MLSKRLEYLDSARGIAAMIVVFAHFKGAYLLPEALTFLEFSPVHILWHGEGAVIFFFLLSGFVISLKYFKDPSKIETLNYSSYLISRIFRIYPVFLMVLVLSILARHFIYQGNIVTTPSITYWIEHLWQNTSSYLHQALLITKFREDPYLHLVPQDWTLQIEMLISALIPFLVIICLRNASWLFILSFIIIGFMGFEPYLIGFVAGIVIAKYASTIINFWKSRSVIAKHAFLITGILFYCAGFIFNLDVHSTSKLSTLIGTVFLLITLISSKRMQSIMSNKTLQFFGSISYCLYLSHMLIIMSIIPILFTFINQHYHITNEYLTRLIGLVSLFTLTIVLSYLLHITVEKPFISISKKLNLRIEGKMRTIKVKLQTIIS